MANNENFLKPLIDICKLIVSTPRECSKQIAQLESYASKGAFYECHTFSKLLELLSENPELEEPKKAEIFKLLKSLTQEGSSNKDYVYSKLYTFLAKLEDRLDLLDGIIQVCLLEKLPDAKLDTLVKINEVLIFFATTNAHFHVIWSNNSTLSSIANQESVNLKQFQSFTRSVNTMMAKQKYEEVAEFLRKTLLLSAINGKLKTLSEAEFEELFKIFKTIGTNASTCSAALAACTSVARNIEKRTGDEEHRQCLAIVATLLQLIHEGSITSKGLKELEFFYAHAKDSTASQLRQNATVLVGKIMNSNIERIESSTEAFNAYHKLSFKFFYVFRDMKNKEGLYSCCSDNKRHEVYNAIKISLEIAINLSKDNKFNQSIARNFQYQVNYCLQVCNELKCDEKIRLRRSFYNRLYNVIFEFLEKTESIKNNIVYLDLYIKVLFSLWALICDDLSSTSSSPENLVWEIYYRASEAPALPSNVYSTSASAMVALLSFKLKTTGSYSEATMDVKKLYMKNIFSISNIVKNLKFESVADFIKSKNFVDPKFKGEKMILDETDFLLMEICTIVRHAASDDPKTVAKLYTELFTSTKDAKVLAEACQGMKDSTLKFVDKDLFKNVNKVLESVDAKQFNMTVSLALALNSYSNYFAIHESVSAELKSEEIKVDKSHLQREIEQLIHLNSSLAHFTDVVHHLMQNQKDLSQIFSMRRVQIVLNNMAIEYFKRGIKYKDLEAFTLLWNLAKLEGTSMLTLLNVGTFFLDNQHLLTDSSGNYIKLSKKLKPITVDEVIETANKLIDEKFIPEFRTEKLLSQGHVLSYLVSLWVHYTTNGRKTDGCKRWDQFNKLWKIAEIPEGSYRDTIISKIYFSVVEINIKCCNRFLVNFLSMAINTVLGIRTIDGEFMSQFCQNYYRITLAAINYSNNRLADMKDYEVIMLTLLSMADKKGYCFKLMDLLSLSITRYLNMEEIDMAMTKLKDITRILGLKEEILSEIPTKIDSSTRIFDFDALDMAVRKSAAAPKSPVHCEISMIHEDQTTELSRKIESFVHKANCKCNICKIPHLKFVMFQIGCHYSRLLWIKATYEVSFSFYNVAIEPWRDICDKLRRTKDSEFLMINKAEFAVFSIRWLFQCADTFIRLGKYSEVEEVYQEIELLNSQHVVDHGCFKQALHCRKENLNFLLEHDLEAEMIQKSEELSFSGFLEYRKGRQSVKSPEIIKVTKAVGALKISRTESSTKLVSKEPTALKEPTAEKKKVQEAAKSKPTISKTASKSFIRSSKSPAVAQPTPKEAIYIDSSGEEDSPVPMKLRKPSKKSPKIETTSSSSKKPEPTPKRAATRKAKTDKAIDELRDSSEPTRKTRRRML